MKTSIGLKAISAFEIIIVTLLCGTSTLGGVVKNYNHVTDKTTIKSELRPPRKGERLAFEVLADYQGEEFNGDMSSVAFLFMFVAESSERRYLDCHNTRWLVDGKPVQLPDAKYDGSVHDGQAHEFIVIGHLGYKDAERIVQAKTVEVKICADHHTMTEEEKNDIRDILAMLVPKATTTQKVLSSYGPDAAVLANENVVGMVQAGFSVDQIVAKIKSTKCHFDTSAQAVIELKQNGVPKEVISEMMREENPSLDSPGTEGIPVAEPKTNPNGGGKK